MAGHHPKSYDDIVRRTVPDPEGSWRPSVEQVQQAYEGYRALDPAEQDLFDRVRDALISLGVDTSRVSVDVERERVTLRGTVTHSHHLDIIEQAVVRVPGVSELVDWLVVETPA